MNYALQKQFVKFQSQTQKRGHIFLKSHLDSTRLISSISFNGLIDFEEKTSVSDNSIIHKIE